MQGTVTLLNKLKRKDSTTNTDVWYKTILTDCVYKKTSLASVTGKTVGEITAKALENGLLVISAGSNVLRFVPPLVITEADIDEMAEKLEKSL